MEEASSASYHVTVPFDVFPLLSKVAGFEKEYKIPKGREDEFLIYQIGGSNVVMKCDPLAVRNVWALACERVTGSRSLENAKFPLLRCGSGFLVSSLNPQCFHEGSPVRARVSIDFDCTDASKPFPDPHLFFHTVCDFLDEHADLPDGETFAEEHAFLFLGSNKVKNRSAHLIFADLCWFPDASSFMKKSSALAKAFTKLMTDEYGMDADIGIKGLKWEFMDKRDKTEWRECVLPLTYEFNQPEWYGNKLHLEFTQLAQLLDPHVLPSDTAWERTCRWIPMEEPVKAAKEPTKKKAKNVAVAPALTVLDRLVTAYPELVDATFAQKDDVLVCVSTHCPLKVVATDSPAGHHSKGGKFYAMGTPSGNITVNCFICQAPVVLRGYQYPDVIDEFAENWVRVSDRAMYVGQYRDPNETSTLFTRDRFKNHVWTCALNAAGTVEIGGKKMKRSDYWWEYTEDRYTGLMYCPPPVKVPRGWYNTWNGFNPEMLEVAKTMEHLSDDELDAEWRETGLHMRENICGGDEESFQHLARFFADMIQNPGRRPKWGVVVWGPQGMGKGLMMTFVQNIIGLHNYRHGDSKTLGENFNADIMDKLLVFSDEGVDGESKHADRYLKKLVTEDRQQVRQKFQDNREMSVYMRVVVSTNDEPTWIKPGDRRWFVLYADVKQPGGLRNNAVAAETESLRGCAAFYLRAKRGEGASTFNPWEAPRSAEKTQIMISSFTGMQRFFHSLVQDDAVLVHAYRCRPGLEEVYPRDLGHGDFWGKEMPKDVMLQGLEGFLTDREFKQYSEKRIWREIYMILPKEHWKPRQASRNNVRLNVFTMPPKELFLAQFAKHFRLEQEQLTQVDPMEEVELSI